MTHYEITSMAREAGLFVPRDGIPRDGALARFAAMAYAAGAAAELAALEQPEQEPEAWINEVMSQAQVFASAWSLVGGRFDDGSAMVDAEQAKQELRSMLLAAPTRREWRSLSEEEIHAALPHEPGYLDFVCVRAIERALRSKNHD